MHERLWWARRKTWCQRTQMWFKFTPLSHSMFDINAVPFIRGGGTCIRRIAQRFQFFCFASRAISLVRCVCVCLSFHVPKTILTRMQSVKGRSMRRLLNDSWCCYVTCNQISTHTHMAHHGHERTHHRPSEQLVYRRSLSYWCDASDGLLRHHQPTINFEN